MAHDSLRVGEAGVAQGTWPVGHPVTCLGSVPGGTFWAGLRYDTLSVGLWC